MQIETLDARSFSDTDLLAIGRLLAITWPNPEKPLEYRVEQMLKMGRVPSPSEEQAPKSFIVRQDDQVIAHSAFIPRTIATEDGEMTIAGLLRVCTDPDQKGRGLGKAIVRAVFDLVDAEVFPFALFQTSEEVRPFYEKLGACVVENKIVNSLDEDPLAAPFWDRVAMRYPSQPDWPAGEIDLRGPGY